MANNNQKRAVIVDGLRTPFVKAYTDFKEVSALELAKSAVKNLLVKTAIDPNEIDEVIMGQVIPQVDAPNLAREVVLGVGLPSHIPGFTLNKACASSAQALISASEGILSGQYEVVLVGGAESMSNVPVPYSKNVIDNLMKLSKAKSITAKLKAITSISLADLVPKPPSIAETSTGKTMGQHAEKMAQINEISREAQDEFACLSHHKAASAIEEGKLSQEITPVYVAPRFGVVDKDSFVRPETSAEQLSSLKPCFDKKYGTLTAGNSTGLTDGASALLVMSEEKALELGYEPLAYVESWHTSALPTEPQLLLAPAVAMPKAVEKAGISWEDVDLIDLHEAFAAQALSVLQALTCDDFAKEHLDSDQAVCEEIDMDKVNVNGGSLALGHPFGATGARIALSMSRELVRRKAQYAVFGICAAGGMGTAVLLKRWVGKN